MRIIVDRWYVVPIAATLAMYACCVVAMGRSHEKIRSQAVARLTRIYSLAQVGSYDRIVQEGLASQDVADYLRQQDKLFGKLTGWDPDVSPESFSDQFSGRIFVKRDLASNWDSVAGSLETSLLLSLDTEVYSGDGVDRGKIDTPEKAKAAARATLDILENGATFKALKAQKVGDEWLITEEIFGQDEPNFLVLSNKGKPLQHVNRGIVTQATAYGGWYD